ncbi:MAG TPA: hypothetical protein VH309_05505 [Elusimicrobiota bacterium]|jgi:hypothetical protein|nr:hypothetical protein [Elusimicrobiota bacterium]
MRNLRLPCLAVVVLAAAPAGAQSSALDQLRVSAGNTAPAAVPSPAARPASVPAAPERPGDGAMTRKALKQSVQWFQMLQGMHKATEDYFSNTDPNLGKFASQRVSDVFGPAAYDEPDQRFALAGAYLADLSNRTNLPPFAPDASVTTFSDYMTSLFGAFDVYLASDLRSLSGRGDSTELGGFTREKTAEVFKDKALQDEAVRALFDKENGVYPSKDFDVAALAAAFRKDASAGSSATIGETVEKLIPRAEWAN